ncbi:MAG: guanylate kinase, partial [Dehalococcoidales bacterium]|nr:guanylate kinase [Dehalococcoidales bacterium]
MNDVLSSFIPRTPPVLVVLSGLSGAGKDAVLKELRKAGLPLYFAVTATTRPPRPGEKDGVDYYFVNRQQFQELIGNGELLEWATVYGHFYGVPRKPIARALGEGLDAVVKVDVQGAATIKRVVPEAVFIFLLTPDMQELERRLRERGTESEAQLQLRLKTAEEELRSLPMFDYVVVNRTGEVSRAAEDVLAIIRAEKCRLK